LGSAGLIRFDSSGSELSPILTDLSAHSCMDRRRQQKSHVFVCADERRGPTHRGAPTAAAVQRAKSIGWQDGSYRALREGKAASKIPSNKGVTPAISPVQSANSSIQGSPRLRCSQTATSDPPIRAWIRTPAIPARPRRSSLRQLAVSPNSRAEPELGTQVGNVIVPIDIGYRL
jgi:hypothetical protein